jgi:hypothetical protein
MVAKKGTPPGKGGRSETNFKPSTGKKRSQAKSKPARSLRAISKKLGVAYLAARGIFGQYATKFEPTYLTSDETFLLESYTKRAPAIQIRYRDLHDRVIKGYWRIRYLEVVLDWRGEPIRYTGPRKVGPFLYFARTWPKKNKLRSWKYIARHPKIEIFITEGEIKACALARLGRAAIGLAGVYAFLKNGKLLPEFSQIDWKGRYVIVVFDNDIVAKPNVRAAMGRLVHELTHLGALPKIMYLPDYELTGEKLGIDDYLVIKKFSKSALDDLGVEDCEETKLLHFINSRIAYIRKRKLFWDSKYEIFYRTDELRTAFAPYRIVDLAKKSNEPKPAATEWLKWPCRGEYDDMVYAPGASSIVGNNLNTWPGWGVESIEGDVRPVLGLISYLLSSCPEYEAWFLQWLAYPIQNPGTKMFTSVLIWSSEQGVGKSLLGEIMGDIYGQNHSEISRDNLTRDFNSWAENKQFIHGDEITGSDSRMRVFADKLKAMITREYVEINKKHISEYSLDDCANYMFTSNHVDALFLEDRDRRFFVIEVSKPKKLDNFYARLRKWRDKPAADNSAGERRGPSALRWYLENQVDLSGFNPYAEAPVTDAKRDMQDLSLSDLNRFTRRLRDDPDSVLKVGRDDEIIRDELFELNRLIAFSDRDTNIDKGIQNAMSKALRNAGFRSRQVRVGKTRPYLWAIRNREKWWKRRPAEWAKQFDKQNEIEYK